MRTTKPHIPFLTQREHNSDGGGGVTAASDALHRMVDDNQRKQKGKVKT